ncbi:MAG: prephenate dehydratase [Clostridia bacterium]|nr:prephenate dehydratase [Clostridia bacterium]
MSKSVAELLGPVRTDIDAIDKELLPLFLKRMDCSRRVAEIKIANNIPVLNPEREKQILDNIREKAGEELGDSAVAFYAAVMGISREYQHRFMDGTEHFKTLIDSASVIVEKENKKILCQGVEGAYSHAAAQEFFGKEADINFCPQFADVFSAIENGEADFGVVPVENSAAGSVSDVYSLIMKYRYYIVGAVNVSVRHCLATKKNAEIKTVYSHPQALNQCKEYIKNKGFEPRQYSNTAAAAKFVSESDDNTIAAICSLSAAEKYGLTVIENNIQDSKNNTTRFAVICKTPVFPENADKISLILNIPNTPGSLYQTLERFAMNGLNLTKIESRPIKDSNFDYEFYLDFTGNIRDENVMKLMESLSAELQSMTFLGNYCEI